MWYARRRGGEKLENVQLERVIMDRGNAGVPFSLPQSDLFFQYLKGAMLGQIKPDVDVHMQGHCLKQIV